MKPVQSRRYKKFQFGQFFILDTPTLKLDIVPNVIKQKYANKNKMNK